MSSRARITAVIAFAALLHPSGPAAADPASAGNPLMLLVLETADFQSRVDLCRNLGKRADPAMADIMDFLRCGLPPACATEAEFLLLSLLSGLLDVSLWGPDGVAERFQANRSGLEAILDRLERIREPNLTALLLKTLSLTGDSGYGGPVLRLAHSYRDRLAVTKGWMDPGTARSAFALLSYAAEFGTADFLEPCLTLSRSSRDADLVRAARSAASRIASRLQAADR